MSKMNIAIGSKKFTWEGDVAALEAKFRHFAGRVNVDPLKFAANVVQEAPRTDASEDERSLQTTAIVYFVLQQDTGHADYPGKYRDYVLAHEFNFILVVDGLRISMEVSGVNSWTQQ